MSDRSAGYKVYAGKVIETGRNFQRTAIEYKNLMPVSGFTRPDTGNVQSNATLETTLRTIGELHLMIAQATYNHGSKLNFAGESYVYTEDATTRLQRAVKEIIPDITLPTPPNP